MKIKSIRSAILAAGLTMLTTACSQTSIEEKKLRTEIAQKIMIDIRYYCEEETSEVYCRTPLTQLPESIAKVISNSNIGGIILFSDNLVSTEQTIKLNYDLQQAAARSDFSSPLLISIDQEGGRVFRTSRAETIAFTGNMSIGATYQKHGSYYARESARVIGSELNALGINVNHAPTVDVNANPKNPVINVRSFGEDPEIVAELGQVQLAAFQQQGIIGTLKHFPGHGDTATDSHTGLPQVNHDIDTIYSMDIGPFKQIIKNQPPGMIMTAHIQYPTLDNSTFISIDGKEMIKPATMSRTILTDILRDELAFEGVVITDAMDMAGIRHFFTEHDAVINSFKAGADIALMPIKIRTPKDLNNLSDLIDSIVAAVNSGELKRAEISRSFERIQKLKTDYKLNQAFSKDLGQEIAKAKNILATPENKAIERQLAEDALTLVSQKRKILPINANESIHLLMPDKTKCLALVSAIKTELGANHAVSCTSMQSYNALETQKAITKADVILGAHIAPRQSAAEMGGMDDLVSNNQLSKDIIGPEVVYDLLAQGKKLNKKVIFVSLRTPYEIAEFSQVADVSLATYAYNTHRNPETGNFDSPALSALAKVITGKIIAKGSLPVTVKKL
ncbi:glycoside hydrolase family 3 N-terminal domain-containing protein [Colwellia piezophila]|uniref:glycoside hydrolase family 3 N-terminal domain-containing protein n=1 Tax=Colwellia piezophila TaxID=211668 RepID=UPI00037885F2